MSPADSGSPRATRRELLRVPSSAREQAPPARVQQVPVPRQVPTLLPVQPAPPDNVPRRPDSVPPPLVSGPQVPPDSVRHSLDSARQVLPASVLHKERPAW